MKQWKCEFVNGASRLEDTLNKLYKDGYDIYQVEKSGSDYYVVIAQAAHYPMDESVDREETAFYDVGGKPKYKEES